MLSIKAFTFNPVQENTYIVYNEQKQCCIIDPGCYFPEEEQELTAYIEETGLEPQLLLNTHCHLDHVFGNRFVAERWGLTLHLHRLEVEMLKMAPASGQLWQLPFENYEGDFIMLKPGESIRLGDDDLEILFTPGHSPGSVSFYNEEAGFVVSGDTLFDGSIGRTDLPGGNFDTLARSIREQLYTLPEYTIVWPGHGQQTTIGEEKRGNGFVRAV